MEVVVGHSGAGAVLPVIAHAAGANATVFVDALVPEPSTTFSPSPGFLALIDQLPVVDGRLPPWHEWWPPGILARLVPNERMRAAVTAEIPTLPRGFYDEPLRLPERWWQQPTGFLQLSPAYADDRARAQQLGWRTGHLDGQHLDLLTRPEAVAEAVIDLTRAAQQPRR